MRGGLHRLRWVAAFSLLTLAAACSGEGEADDLPSSGQAASSRPPQAGELRIDHAAQPLLLRAGDGLVVIAVRTDEDGADAGIVTATRASGTWSEPTELSAPDLRTSPPQVALNDAGAGVAAWAQWARGDDDLETSPPVIARIRRADGSWEAPERLDGLVYVEQVVVNARGDVAVLGYPDDGGRRIALHPAGGGWTDADPEWYDAVSIALDEQGGLHAALTGTERGGGGAVSTRYLPAGGEWTAPEPVRTGPTATEAARILALPGGGEALVVGAVSPRWQSTFDTQSYWSTAQQVLRRDSRDEPFAEVWAKDGATHLQAAVRGDAVDLAWLQLAQGRQVEGAEGPVTVPTSAVLTAMSLGGQEVRLAQTAVREEVDDTHGTIVFSSASGCAEQGVVWRPVGVDDVPGDLGVALLGDPSVSGGGGGVATGDPLVFGLEGALACAGGDEPWVADVEDAVRAGSADRDDLRLVDATVVVAPLG